MNNEELRQALTQIQCVAIVHGVRCERIAIHFPEFSEHYSAPSFDGPFTRIESCSPLCEECYQAIREHMRNPDIMRFDPSRWTQVSAHAWSSETPDRETPARRKSKHKHMKEETDLEENTAEQSQ